MAQVVFILLQNNVYKHQEKKDMKACRQQASAHKGHVSTGSPRHGTVAFHWLYEHASVDGVDAVKRDNVSLKTSTVEASQACPNIP